MSDEKLIAALKPWLREQDKESVAVDKLRAIVRELWLSAVDEAAAKEKAEK